MLEKKELERQFDNKRRGDAGINEKGKRKRFQVKKGTPRIQLVPGRVIKIRCFEDKLFIIIGRGVGFSHGL
jgi:hypothetical protein